VAKVKKRARVTGVRNIKVKNGKAKKKAVPKTAKRVEKRRSRTTIKKTTKTTKTTKTAKSGVKKRVLKVVRGRKAVSDGPVVTVAVRALDPLRKCGPNTTVQLLYRVDESVDGRRTAHLVFFDRHGWYCEHGRTCPAVGHAKKHNGQIARVS
jgi:hypothetical protein